MSNLISIAGGGTSASTAATARTNLGLGTLALQDASTVSITGGTIAGDGSGLTTLNASNLASGTVPQARKWTSITITSTGTVDDLNFSNADEVRVSNASALTITGLVAGVAGQRVAIVSVGAGHVFLANETGSSSANQLLNKVTSGPTPLAAGAGAAMYQYDGTTQRWRLVQHEQGAFIDIAFDAGHYAGSGAMTWTVDAGDVQWHRYYLHGVLLTITFGVQNTSVGGTLNLRLVVSHPTLGYTWASTQRQYYIGLEGAQWA